MGLAMASSRFPLRRLLLVAAVTVLNTTVNADECASDKNLFEQISCYAAAAKATNDLAACDRASHDGVRYQCYAIFAEYAVSPDACRKIPSATGEHRSLIDGCLSDVARKARDPGLCDHIETSGLRDSCYLKLAKALGDPALCAKIQDTGLRSACTGEPVNLK